MARILGYIATSMDGFIADAGGGVGWLDAFQGHDYGYERFIAGIGTVVLGRGTYDFVAGAGVPWPYAGKRTFVLTHRSPERLPDNASVHAGPALELIPRLRSIDGGDVWVVGGGRVLTDFVLAGGIDVLDQFVMPLALGSGIPLWTAPIPAGRLTLEEARALPGGVALQRYVRAGE